MLLVDYTNSDFSRSSKARIILFLVSQINQPTSSVSQFSEGNPSKLGSPKMSFVCLLIFFLVLQDYRHTIVCMYILHKFMYRAWSSALYIQHKLPFITNHNSGICNIAGDFILGLNTELIMEFRWFGPKLTCSKCNDPHSISSNSNFSG